MKSARYCSVTELAEALQRAADAHHEYEKELGYPDEDWAAWYADFMMRDSQIHGLECSIGYGVDLEDYADVFLSARPIGIE